MKTIPLTRNKFAKICDCHYELVAKYKWQCGNHGYATREQHISYDHATKKKTRKTIMMHRLIMDTPNDLDTDHINGDKLDNRCSNLRVCTTTQNIYNRRPTASTGYKGVYKRYNGKYQVAIKNKTIGTYSDIKDAILAYNKAASDMYGDFAYINSLARKI